ncbi:integrase core domain-containing protein [Streptomyces rhizosphaericola]|uniref:integrase core domain-containing protein n=1 Tax=Streptomyces rhizosphaericola TaxID=2564098 RepID=UPI00369F750F
MHRTKFFHLPGHRLVELGQLVRIRGAGLRVGGHFDQRVFVANGGSGADSYDNATAEALNVTSKVGLIEHQGPWHDADQVERAVVQWDGWYITERLHSALDYLPPEEFEAAYYRSTTTPNAVWNTQDRPLRHSGQLTFRQGVGMGEDPHRNHVSDRSDRSARHAARGRDSFVRTGPDDLPSITRFPRRPARARAPHTG